jgi:hypothetical protein
MRDEFVSERGVVCSLPLVEPRETAHNTVALPKSGRIMFPRREPSRRHVSRVGEMRHSDVLGVRSPRVSTRSRINSLVFAGLNVPLMCWEVST